MFNKGTKYLEKGNFIKALSCFKSFEKTNGISKENSLNMGNCYRQLDQLELAEKCYRIAMDHRTPFLNATFGPYDLALSNMGLLTYARGNDDEAIKYYRDAIKVNDKHYDAIWNCASAYLRKYCSGEDVDLASAWQMYEFRFMRSNPTPVDKSLPTWDGISSGNSIVVLAEQGLGDKIQFGRYVSLLRNYFKRVWVQTPQMLNEIFSDYECVEVVSDTDADVSIPICSLAARFGIHSARSDWLRDKFGTFNFDSSDRLNVGCVWQGSSTHPNTRNRNTYNYYFSNLAKYANFYCLSPGMQAKNVVGLNPGTWKKTAEYVNGLDLVISVDTSIVHLAGSLGKETWMLQPLIETDFRWGRNGGKSIWYDSVEIFNNPGSWDKVFANVEERLRAKCIETGKLGRDN